MKGFTPKESAVIVFLCLGFLGGLAVKTVKKHCIPLASATGPAPSAVLHNMDSRLAPRRVNINLASKEALQDLPGIGPVMAQRIIDYRIQHGRFQSVDALKRVKGIGQKSVERLQSHVILYMF